MANEFRVKNGLIVDEVSNGAGVLTIADGDIANDDGSIAITVVDGQSVTIGKEGDHANIIVTPHNAAGEKITVLNTTGTDAAAIKLNALAGGIDVDAAKAISLTTTGAAGDISLVTAHTAGVAFHLDANADAASEVQIDAGILDIDVTGAATIDTGGALTLTSAADFTIDSNTDIILDANGADITFKDDGTATHHFFNGSSISKVEFGYNAEISPTDTAHNVEGRTLEIAGGDTTAGSSDDQPGGNITIRGGYGKGDAAGGNVTLSVASTNGASSGSSLNNTRDAFISISGTNGSIVLNDSLAGTTVQSAGLTLAPKGGVTGQNSVVDFTLGDNSSSNHNNDRRILYATSEATFRAALNMDGSGSMGAPIWELGVGGTVTANTTTALPTQPEYTTAATAFAFGAAGSVYRIGKDNATNGQVLTFNGTEWLAEDVSGTGDVSASSNFGTDNVLIRSDGTSKGVKHTGITVANTTDNMSGIGTISSKGITAAPGSSGGVALTLTATDVDAIALDINASNTTANVLDITADAVTTAHVIDVSANGLTGTGGFMKMATTGLAIADTGTSALMDMVVSNDSVGSQTAYGMSIDYNKDGVTGDGKTAIVAGLAVDIDDSATNHDNSTATIYGGIFTSNSANAGGTIKNIGVYASAGGGDTNYAGEFAGDMLFTSDTATFTSSNANDPLVVIKNTTNDVNGATLRFVKDRGGAGTDGMDIGTISFFGDNAAQEQTAFASIVAEVSTAADTDEAGKLSFFVSESNGTAAQLTAGLILVGQSTDDGEVDVTIGAGANSTVTIPGNLTVTGTTTTVHVETTTTSSGVIFEGTTGDGHDGTLKSVVAGADVTYTLPNVGGFVALFSTDPSTTAISSTVAELNLLDGSVADTVVNSKAVIYGSGGEITASALTVDSIEVDGKVITMTGSSSDTVVMTAAANGEFTIETTDAGGAAGHMNLDADGKIVLNTADDEHVVFEQAGVDYLAIGQGTVAIGDIEDSAGATVVDTWDASVYTAVKYLLVVENVTDSTQRMAVEMFVMGDDQPAESAAYSTTYAVLYDAEIGVFSAAGRSSSNLIDLKYTPTATGGTVNHRVRVVAQRVASLT